MKNKFLLLSATALLSMNLPMKAMAANATDYGNADISTVIHAEATLIDTIDIQETKTLNFGSIIKPKNNQVVIVEASGMIGAGTTASVMTSNSGESAGISAGQLQISGDYMSDLVKFELVEEEYKFNFPTEIVLKSDTITCGVVDKIGGDTNSITVENGTVNYGGRFTLDGNINGKVPANGSLSCKGEGTVTVIYTNTSEATSG